MSIRRLEHVIHAMPTSDGAGVKLRRSLGQSQSTRLDPFLMLDEFSSDQPGDYIAGFPPHPHRGFETVTYMLDGHMLHEDNMGNRGDLKSGDVQWMTAGRGIIHSEMPQQERGLLRGFQLWINLPAKEKMKPASYRDISSFQIPVIERADGVWIKVIAGKVMDGEKHVEGPVSGRTTEPLYLDVRLPKGGHFSHALIADHNAFVYAYEGNVEIGAGDERRLLAAHNVGVLSHGEQIELYSEGGPARMLLLAGRPLKEPVVQRGPFVMNTREEIEQALYDYQHGQLV